ncbi:glycosyltransferase family 39 protein [Methyloceanibacter sp.]|uniref:glycosyltransferase family 39 protein n=1 Tax=Methyloceanibacter sp. TaxID=1965321 RepID=UPI002D3CDE50|nr:glycosyltransferase family 39 protein [Methyloceanibacter sp.]HZP08659.1 glycosyltransferase family 39 protein [Methyloceanibacter sp.]
MTGHAAVAGGNGDGKATAPSWGLGLLLVVGVGLAYGLAYSTLRLSLSDNLPQDDVTSNVLTQTLALGYVPRQPPLYEWLLWSVQQLTGPTLPSFLIIKYGLLTATVGFLYLAATRIFSERSFTVLAGLSPFFLFQFAWNLHEGVTHSMVLTSLVAASLWAVMRVAEKGRIIDYLLFGLIAGLGLISKWGFAAFLLLLFIGAMLQPALRRRILAPRFLVSLGTIAVVGAPVAYWLIAGQHDLVALYGSAVAPKAHVNRLRATLVGLGLSIYAPLGFLFPLDAILPVLFPACVPKAWCDIKRAASPKAWGTSEPDWPLLILHMSIGGFLLLMLGALLTGASHYLERYMHPFFLLTPLWMLSVVAQMDNAARKAKVLGVVLAASLLIVFPIRVRDSLHAMGPDCNKCRIATPYAGLAEALEARGFEDGTIVALSRHDAGNLRRFFPNARIVCLDRPNYGPPMRGVDARSEAVVIWRPEQGEDMPAIAQGELDRLKASPKGAAERIEVPWQPYPATSKPKEWAWMIQLFAPGEKG